MPVVDVWTADLNVAEGEIQRLENHLDSEERARAERFRFARDRRRFVVRRGLLREQLERVVNEPANQLNFTLGKWGKPALRDHQCCFSLSHSGEHMAVAISDLEVGCDIERVDPELNWRPIAEELLDLEARRHLATLTPTEAHVAFFRLWTRIEARLKAAGYGLGHSNASVLEADNGYGCPWEVADVDAIPGYALAIAVARDSTPCEVRVMRFQRA